MVFKLSRASGAIVALCLMICDARAEDAPASDAPAARPNMAVGRILTQDGKPLAVKDMKIEVAVSGITDAGEKVTYTPEVADDGSWSTKLAPGKYKAPRGTMVVTFNKKEFFYELVPANASGDFDAKDGVSSDLVWHVTGPRPLAPAEPNPDNAQHFFGAAVSVALDRFSEGPKTPEFAKKGDETKLVFVVTPVGKLIDGSEGEPKIFELKYDKLFEAAKPSKLHDLPVGKYKLVGSRVTGDGTGTPLRLKVQGHDKWVEEEEFEINPDATNKQALGPKVFYQAK